MAASATGAGVALCDPSAGAAASAGPEAVSPNLAFMVWRIGDILDFDAQVAWVAEAGFESVAFHASPGRPGQWRGVDPGVAGATERARLRAMLEPFKAREIHAPFETKLEPDTPEMALDMLDTTCAFAGDVGADVVTVHADPPPPDVPEAPDTWQAALDRLNAAAEKADIRIGIEFMQGFEWLRRPRRERIGATLDVGHMYLDDGAGYRPYGGIGDQIRDLDDVLFNMHIHDYNGEYDHIEIGTGRVDVDAVLRGLADIGYHGILSLELNPDRVSPEGIVRSAAFLRQRARALSA